MSFDFLMTSLIVVVIPGTGVIYTVSVSLARGGRAGVIAAVGCTLGIVPHLMAAAFGLSAFLPQFLSAEATLSSLLGLGVVFMAMTFAVFAVYAIVGGRLGTAFSTRTTLRDRIEKSMGLLLAGFAVRLALTER
jgi:threonine/homoserine/homoserine lactone efflux protein